MTVLVWTDRDYKTGVDRGIFAVEKWDLSGRTAPSVPWNGLISVEETSVGGDVEPAYMDGKNFANVAGNRYFQANVTAFSAPGEFDECNGLTNVVPGFSLDNQTKKRFLFSYRVMKDVGYEIHLVYNCLALPSAKEAVSLSEQIDPATLSWVFAATPVVIGGTKPTAHFVVDSVRCSGADLTALEDRLYGTAIAAPDFPTPAQLKTIFTT
ncbi:MAG TPA: hypothetical protein PKD12_08195 [Nitrospira sp.]|nr:hypothetical protein [Nitrospira sp.]